MPAKRRGDDGLSRAEAVRRSMKSRQVRSPARSPNTILAPKMPDAFLLAFYQMPHRADASAKGFLAARSFKYDDVMREMLMILSMSDDTAHVQKLKPHAFYYEAHTRWVADIFS